MTALPPLPAPLSRALADKGYDTLTPVQAAVLAPEVAGQDLLVSAQTGSGKTVAFGLAMAESLLPDGAMMPPPDTARALIIAPTRELALQVRRELEWLYGSAGGVIASCVGGMDARTERRALERGAHIVVGTPGRLRDHIERGALDLTTVGSVALDEADEMLDLGFREDLEFILQALPDERRTLLFSATVPPSIERLAQTYQKNARRIATETSREAHGDIAYRAMVVAADDAEHAIVNVLRFYEARNALGILQDPCGGQPSDRAAAEPRLFRGTSVRANWRRKNARAPCRRCATAGRGSAWRPTWRPAASTCRGWNW